MHLNVSKALVIHADCDSLIGMNFLKKTGFACNDFIFKILDLVSEGVAYDQLTSYFPEIDAEDFKEAIETLVELGALVLRDSSYCQEEREKLENWEWGIPSALFHYCDLNKEFVSPRQAHSLQVERIQEKEQPNLYTLNTNCDEVIPLNHHGSINAILKLMSERRTVRENNGGSISLEVLTDCIFAGLGITGEVVNDAGVILPLSMTPSGGARNPYEAYVYVKSVNGLEAGIYHYSAKEHSLGLIDQNLSFTGSELLTHQEWVDDMSCVVILCAHFERTMWKYRDNIAYQAVLIEAGHIGQNIMLAATSHQCTACPTAALAHDKIKSLLKIDEAMVSPVYALAIGKK